MEKHNIIISKIAFEMLDSHVIFLARVSPKSAHSLRKTFKSAIASLYDNPKGYPLWLPHFEVPYPYRKILIMKRYLILYYKKENNVYVDFFIDNRMDNESLFT